MIILTNLRTCQVLRIIAYGQYQLVCHQSLRYQIERHTLSHLLYHHTGFLRVIGFLQHLSATERVRFWPVCLHSLHRARFPTPGMIYQQFCIHAKKTIELLLVMYRHPRQLTHGVDTIHRQFLRNTASHSPELRDRTIIPEFATIRHFIQFGDTHTILVCRHLLSHNIHRHLTEIHVRTDACCCRDACLFQHIADHLHRQFMGRHLISTQVGRHIHDHLVNRIHMDILRGNVFQIDAVNLRAHLNIVCHLWRGSDIVNSPVWMLFQLYIG